jgi:hypothetical protein
MVRYCVSITEVTAFWNRAFIAWLIPVVGVTW